MTGKQLGGLLVAGALAAGIYLLPQTVVQSKNDTLPASGPNATAAQTPTTAGPDALAASPDTDHFEGDGHDHGDGPHEEGDGHDHSSQRQELTAEARAHIQSLKESASKTEDKEKFAIFADSLASNWSKLAWHDSAAYWAEKAVVARPTLERRLKAGSLWFEAYQLAPDVVLQRQYSKQAEGHLKKVLERAPQHTEAQIQLALIYVVSENPMQGILLLRQVLEREPKNTKALFHMGVLSFQSSQYDKAIQRFEQLVGLDATHKEGHFYLALSYIELGQSAKAREHLLAVQKLETDPEVKSLVDGYLKKLDK